MNPIHHRMSIYLPGLLLVSFLTLFPLQAGSVLTGPILAVKNTQYQLQIYDVGLQQLKVISFDGDFQFQWLPDGCSILISRNKTSGIERFRLSLTDFSLSPFTYTGFPYWSPDGQWLALLNSDYQNNTSTITLVNTHTGEEQNLIEANYLIYQVRWLTNRSLAFIGQDHESGDTRFIWNQPTGELQAAGKPYFQTDLYLNAIYTGRFYTLGSIQDRFVSPDETRFIGFFDRRRMELETGETDIVNIRSSIASGLDLYSLATEEKRHIEIDQQFIEAVEWSPSGRQILIQPYSREIGKNTYYLFAVESETLKKLDMLPVSRSVAGFIELPTWSPDEAWLAVQAEDGPMIYWIETGATIKLPDAMSTERLRWSPVMDYAPDACH